MADEAPSRARTTSYRDLIVYQKSYELALEIQKLTLSFPNCKRYESLVARRLASGSLPLSGMGDGR